MTKWQYDSMELNIFLSEEQTPYGNRFTGDDLILIGIDSCTRADEAIKKMINQNKGE